MPVEIRHLAIRAVIDSGGKKGNNSTNAGPEARPPGDGGGSVQSSGELIDLCVEKVMEILKERSER
ncbi:MAG TPA: DUF5908 family protein [Puia sp.]|nr:DUF5908 family protein [Puia sp.]